MNRDDKILEEIRRQAFIRAREKDRKVEARQDTRHTLDVLQALTGLTRHELQGIADTVSTTCDRKDDNFFSIKDQFLMVSAGLVLSGMFIWALLKLLI